MNKQLKDIDEIAAICSDCGTCLHACPVYNAEWVEPNSPRGKVNLIKALRDGKLEPNRLNRKFIYQCLVCGSCKQACTKGVDFTGMMTAYRNEVSGGSRIPFIKKVILFLYQSVIFRKFLWVTDILSRTPLRKRLTLPRRRRVNLKRFYAEGEEGKEYDILLFPGCVLTMFYPELIGRIYTVLKEKGFSVVLPKGLSCCGAPFRSQGWDRKFVTLRKRNMNVFSRYRFKYLVVPCGTGVGAFREYYGLEGVEVYELTEFFHKFLPDARVNAFEGGRTGWHDPCHHLKGLGLGKAPRHFMKQLGENFIDDDTGLCCGFGGIFSVGFPSTSRIVLERKEERLKELRVDRVVTSCPGCYFQLRENLDQEIKFFIELF